MRSKGLKNTPTSIALNQLKAHKIQRPSATPESNKFSVRNKMLKIPIKTTFKMEKEKKKNLTNRKEKLRQQCKTVYLRDTNCFSSHTQ